MSFTAGGAASTAGASLIRGDDNQDWRQDIRPTTGSGIDWRDSLPVRGSENVEDRRPLEEGNIDVEARWKSGKMVRNPDGTVSTLRSISFREDGKEVLIPTINDDGQEMSNKEAIAYYKRTGRHLGKFRNSEDATQFAINLSQEHDELGWMETKTSKQDSPKSRIIKTGSDISSIGPGRNQRVRPRTIMGR